MVWFENVRIRCPVECSVRDRGRSIARECASFRIVPECPLHHGIQCGIIQVDDTEGVQVFNLGIGQERAEVGHRCGVNWD